MSDTQMIEGRLRDFIAMPDDADWEDVLRRVEAPVAASTFRRDRPGHAWSRRKGLVAAAVALVLAAGATSAAFATGLLGGAGGSRAAQIIASTTGVTSVHVVSASADGHASIVEGVKDGAVVAAATIGDSTTPFVPLTTLLTGRDIAAHTGAGGSAGSVAWVAAAGVVSDRVARVEIKGHNGAVQSVTLSAGTFAIELQPSFRPTAIAAYDKTGHEIASVAFPTEQAPATP